VTDKWVRAQRTTAAGSHTQCRRISRFEGTGRPKVIPFPSRVEFAPPRRAGAGFAAPVWCGVWFGPSPTSGQYFQVAGTQRKASPATATWQMDGKGR
jgi:hypothetical protein